MYFGASVRLLHGVMPYRGFVLVQPPGIVLVLTPLALLARLTHASTGFEAARLAVVGVLFADFLLFGRLTRQRQSLALAFGLVVFVFHPSLAFAGQTVLIEPFLLFATLLGMTLLFNGEEFTGSSARWVLAGAAFGVAGAFKLLAIVPVAAVAVVALKRRERNGLGFLVGAAATFLLVTLPFLVVAPKRALQDVISAQAGRANLAPSVAARLSAISGFGQHNAPGLAVAAVAVAVAAWLVVVHMRRGLALTTLEIVAVIALVGLVVSFAAAPSYFDPYAAYAIPFLAILAGSAAQRLLASPLRAPVFALVGVLALGYIGHGVLRVAGEAATPSVAAAVDRVTPPGSCVLTDEPSLLLLANRFSAARGDCPQVVDIYGTELAYGHGYAEVVADERYQAVQDIWLDWLRRADEVVFVHLNTATLGWTAEVRAELALRFPVVRHIGTISVFEQRR